MSRVPIGGVVACVLVMLSAAGCAGAATAAPPAPAAAAASTGARVAAAAKPTAPGDERTARQRAEDTFIAVTAANLCTVQSSVYADPEAMAAAYVKVPLYPGLTAQQVVAFRALVTTDKAFAARVYRRLQGICKPGAP